MPRVPIKGPQGNLLPLPRSLRVCTMSADFWGLPTAGGTATAYGLLTSALSEDSSLDVSQPSFAFRPPRGYTPPASSWHVQPGVLGSCHSGIW